MQIVRNTNTTYRVFNKHKTYSIKRFFPFKVRLIILYVYKKINIGKDPRYAYIENYAKKYVNTFWT